MTTDTETRSALIKGAEVWVMAGGAWIMDHITGQGIVLLLAGIHTLLQIFLLFRDRIIRRRRSVRESQRMDLDDLPRHHSDTPPAQ